MYQGYWLVSDLDGTLLPTPSKAGGRYCSFTDCATQWGTRHRSCLPALQHFLQHGGSLCILTTAGRRVWKQVYNDLAPALFPEDDDEVLTRAETASPGRLLICGFTGAALFRSRHRAAVWRDYARVRGEQTERLGDAVTASPRRSPPLPPRSSRSPSSIPPRPFYPPASLAMEEWVEYRLHALQSTNSRQSLLQPARHSSEPEDAHTATTLSPEMTAVATNEARAAVIRLFEHVSYISGHNVERAGRFLQTCLSTKYHAVYESILGQLLQEVEQWDGAAAVRPRPDGSVRHLCFAHTRTLGMEALRTHGKYLQETNDALVDAQAVPLPDGSVAENQSIAQVIVMGIPMIYCSFIFPLTPDAATTTSATRMVEAAAAAADAASHTSDTHSPMVPASFALPLSVAAVAEEKKTSSSSLPSSLSPRALSTTSTTTSNTTTASSPGRSAVSEECATVAWNCCKACREHARGARARLAAMHISLKSQPNSACMHRAGVGKYTCIRWLVNHAEELQFDLARAVSLGDVPASVDKALAQFPPMPLVSFSKRADDGLSETSSIRANTFHVGGEEEGAAVFLEKLLLLRRSNTHADTDRRRECDAVSKRARREEDVPHNNAESMTTRTRAIKSDKKMDARSVEGGQDEGVTGPAASDTAKGLCKGEMLFSPMRVRECAQRAERQVAEMLHEHRREQE